MSEAPIALVTGASRGIGAGIAAKLAESGYDIWLNYRSDHDAAAAVKEKIEKLGRVCTLLPFDVANEEAMNDKLQPLLDEVTPYALIHNAGITRDGLLAMMPREDWDLVLNVHLTAFFLLSRLLVKFMMRERRGRIVAISSLSGQAGQAGQFNYAAAKAGMIGAVKTLAKEVGKRKILVNAVAPGFIETEMIQDLPLDKMLGAVPLNRVGTVSEVSGLVDFLLSEDAGYITGQVIGVNGGMYM